MATHTNAHEDPALKPLKIKTGVCLRIMKEATSYQRELAEQNAKLDRMRNSDDDSHDIKKQVKYKS